MVNKIINEPKGFHPFGELIGLKFTKLKKGYSQCILEVNEKLLNPHKVLHGGVMYAMADTGAGGAVYTYLEQGELCATVEVKIVYFSSVKSGTVICDTHVINRRKKIVIFESEIKNDDRLVAKAYGTYSIFKAREK
ncbi:MAG: PaaI family thioesterase [Candidatus Helarchaeota archaeon]